MSSKEKFMLWCHELTEFCLANGGVLFKTWTRERVFLHLAVNSIAGTLFVVKNNDKVKAVGIAKPMNQDCVFVEEVIGNRESCREIYRRVMQKWPTLKRAFSERADKDGKFRFVELKGVHRLCRT